MAENDRSHVAVPIDKSNRRTANCERAGNVAIIRVAVGNRFFCTRPVYKDGMLTLLGGVSVVRDQGV